MSTFSEKNRAWENAKLDTYLDSLDRAEFEQDERDRKEEEMSKHKESYGSEWEPIIFCSCPMNRLEEQVAVKSGVMLEVPGVWRTIKSADGRVQANKYFTYPRCPKCGMYRWMYLTKWQEESELRRRKEIAHKIINQRLRDLK